jgi:A/G-specific adenine glycosylase
MPENHAFIPPLLDWFNHAAANLPWRRTTDPYHIWLSEIMLQQTQVNTVIPYYERFLQAFPTIQALAEAPQDVLMKQWEGLGYYSRARNLQTAAQQVIAEHGGKLPQTADELQTLKGIGRYTAGAIASIAFGEAAPVLDGNVIRVFSRLFDIADDTRQQSVKNAFWDRAEALIEHVPAGRAGDYNQALMELGRTVCKPKNPDCAACPVSAYCAAYTAGVQHERPVKSKKAPTPHYDVTCGLIWNADGQLLITKRPEDKLLGGLWEFPGGKLEEDETLAECLARELHEELGIAVDVGPLYMKVKHAYTHFKITLHAFDCTLLPASPPPHCVDCTDFRWVRIEQLNDYAFSRADRKIIADLVDRPNQLF